MEGKIETIGIFTLLCRAEQRCHCWLSIPSYAEVWAWHACHCRTISRCCHHRWRQPHCATSMQYPAISVMDVQWRLLAKPDAKTHSTALRSHTNTHKHTHPEKYARAEHATYNNWLCKIPRQKCAWQAVAFQHCLFGTHACCLFGYFNITFRSTECYCQWRCENVSGEEQQQHRWCSRTDLGNEYNYKSSWKCKQIILLDAPYSDQCWIPSIQRICFCLVKSCVVCLRSFKRM